MSADPWSWTETFSRTDRPRSRPPHDCSQCLGSGAIETGRCTCEYPYAVPGTGHHPTCGLEPCPNGCEYRRASE